MNWVTKSITILGLVITAATALASFMHGISPELAKLGMELGPVIAAFGFRKKMQEGSE